MSNTLLMSPQLLKSDDFSLRYDFKCHFGPKCPNMVLRSSVAAMDQPDLLVATRKQLGKILSEQMQKNKIFIYQLYIRI